MNRRSTTLFYPPFARSIDQYHEFVCRLPLFISPLSQFEQTSTLSIAVHIGHQLTSFSKLTDNRDYTVSLE